jgi:hypothetical protein
MDLEGMLDFCITCPWLIALEAFISGEASKLTWILIIVMRNIRETGNGGGMQEGGILSFISIIFVCAAKVALEKIIISLHFLTLLVS